MVLPKMISFRTYAIGGGGLTLLTLGAVLLYTWSSLVKNIIHEKLQLKQGSDSFKLWKDTPVPQYMNFYLFNWLNPENLGTEKPKFSQLGPYKFSIKERKTDIVWNNNGTISYKIQRVWNFDEANSNGKLEDEVVTLNPVALSAARTVRYKDIIMKRGLSTSLWTTNIHVKQTVGDILFFGYSDQLLTIGRSLPAFANIEIPPYDKFAWFYLRNGSDTFEGTFNMDTGVNDIYSFGKLRNWNYNKSTPFYPETCGMINGSAGELFPPDRTKTNIELFSADLCRSVSLSYSKEVDFFGVTGYKYVGDKYTFDNGSLNPSNKCFCSEECSPSGVLNVTKCRFGAPGFISFPHFYSADNYFLDQVEGLKPVAEQHTLYLILEPETGIPLDVAARFQINLLLSPVEDIGLYENVPTIYFPMMWFEHRATITEALAAEVQLVSQLPFIGKCFSIFLCVLGGILLLVSLYPHLPFAMNKKEMLEDMKTAEGTVDPLLESEMKEKGMILNEKK